MRLDKFLKVSRLIKRRSVANEVCDASRVTVNGKPAKAAHAVKEGDVLEIRYGSGLTRVRILSVKENPRKDEAASMYNVLNDE